MNDPGQKTSITRSQRSLILGSLKAAALGGIVGTAIGLPAFSFLTWRQHPGMGLALFLLVPIAAGLSSAMVARKLNITAAAAMLSVISSLIWLIALGKEGVLCAVLALAIIAAASKIHPCVEAKVTWSRI